jgi:acyl dehydratase
MDKEANRNIKFQNILDGTILTRENSIKLLPFLLYLSFLALLYIGNTYYAEKTVRDIEKTKTELKELRYEFIATKAELMHQSKQSEVAKNLEKAGLKESMTPPQKIYVNKK